MEILLNYELLKLLKEYEKKGLLADEDFIKTAAKIILEKRRCQREVDDIVIGENAILFEIPMFDENSTESEERVTITSVKWHGYKKSCRKLF